MAVDSFIVPTPCRPLAEVLTTTPKTFGLVSPADAPGITLDGLPSTLNVALDPGRVIAHITNADAGPRTVVFLAGNLPSGGGPNYTVTVDGGADPVFVGPFEPARFLYRDATGRSVIRVKVGEADVSDSVTIELVQLEHTPDGPTITAAAVNNPTL